MPSRHPVRYRRCPSCSVVLRALEFPRAMGPTNVAGQLQRRRCPACDFIGPLLGFPIAERPAEPDEGSAH